MPMLSLINLFLPFLAGFCFALCLFYIQKFRISRYMNLQQLNTFTDKALIKIDRTIGLCEANKETQQFFDVSKYTSVNEFVSLFKMEYRDGLNTFLNACYSNIKQKDCLDNQDKQIMLVLNHSTSKNILLSYIGSYNNSDYFSIFPIHLTNQNKEINLKFNSKFLTLANSLPTYLVIIDSNGQVQFTNASFNEFIGDRLERFKHNWLEFVIKEDRSAIAKQWQSALRTKQPKVLNYRYVDESGITQHIETHLNPIKDEHSGELVWYASSINNSKMVLLKDEIEQLAAKREGILQNMEDGFISVTRELVIDFVNFRAEIMFQLPQQPLGVSLKKASSLFNDKEVSKHINKSLELMQSSSFEFSYKQSEFYIRIYPTATGLSFYIQDITAEKESRNELKLLRTAIDKANDVVLITTSEIAPPGPTVVYANEAFERVTGYKRSEVIGNSPRMMQGEKTERQQLDLLKSALTRSEPIRILLTNYTKSGKEYFNEVDISPIINNKGETTHFVAIERDISKQKQQEDLAFRAHKMDSIGLVTGGVAHDFNNLLTIILGNCEILTQQLSDAKNTTHHEHLQAITDATKQGVSLTRSLLAFSKRQPFNKNIVELDSVLKSVIPLIKTALGAQFEFKLNDNCTSRKLGGDLAQLESMFLNMAINARDAMNGSGSFTINIEDKIVLEGELLNQFLEQGDYVLIQYIDSGSGIPKDVIDKIFDPFFSTKALTKGTGLGLSMIYSYIDQCGGYIFVDSKVGEGTTFNVYLPAGATVAQIEDKKVDNVNQNDVTTNYAGKTVLITEDTLMVAKVATYIFNELGFNVLLATDGVEALQILDKNPDISLLFTDIILPNGIDGKELATNIRNKIPSLPVIYTSGFTDGKLSKEDYQQFNTQFLQKPYTKNDLLLTINNISFD